MASSTTIDVDNYGGNIEDSNMETLDFQDIPHKEGPSSPEKGQTTHFTQFPHSAVDSDDEEDDKDKLIKEEKAGTSSFWTFAYYQQFFDVETSQVGQRITGSMVPRPGSNYLMHQIRPNPDLYGPFWICTTLVFTTAIAGNLANYFSNAGQAYHWQYDFHKVTLAATAIFSYWWLVPLLLWAVLWWRGSQAKFSFLEMLCVYGYSLAIYVPISILWAIQVSWLQWMLVLIGAALSGSVLLLTFWPAVKEDSQKIAIGLMVFIFIMHAALAAGFVLYFFYVPASSTHGGPVTPLPLNKTTVAAAGNLPHKLPQAPKGGNRQVANSNLKTPQQQQVNSGVINRQAGAQQGQSQQANVVNQQPGKVPSNNVNINAVNNRNVANRGQGYNGNMAANANQPNNNLNNVAPNNNVAQNSQQLNGRYPAQQQNVQNAQANARQPQKAAVEPAGAGNVVVQPAGQGQAIGKQPQPAAQGGQQAGSNNQGPKKRNLNKKKRSDVRERRRA